MSRSTPVARTPDEAIATTATSNWPCMLCGASDAPNVNVFLSNSRKARTAMGAPEGKKRAVFFRTCDRCYEAAKHDLTDFERRLLKALFVTGQRGAADEERQ